MQVTAELLTGEETTRTVTLDDGADAADLVETLDAHPQAHVVIRDGTPLPLDAELADGDEVQVLRIVSGGAQ